MVDSVAAASDVQTNATNSKAKLTDNFDTFLTLLTAQLQNQDPTISNTDEQSVGIPRTVSPLIPSR